MLFLCAVAYSHAAMHAYAVQLAESDMTDSFDNAVDDIVASTGCR